MFSSQALLWSRFELPLLCASLIQCLDTPRHMCFRLLMECLFRGCSSVLSQARGWAVEVVSSLKCGAGLWFITHCPTIQFRFFKIRKSNFKQSKVSRLKINVQYTCNIYSYLVFSLVSADTIIQMSVISWWPKASCRCLSCVLWWRCSDSIPMKLKCFPCPCFQGQILQWDTSLSPQVCLHIHAHTE